MRCSLLSLTQSQITIQLTPYQSQPQASQMTPSYEFACMYRSPPTNSLLLLNVVSIPCKFIWCEYKKSLFHTNIGAKNFSIWARYLQARLRTKILQLVQCIGLSYICKFTCSSPTIYESSTWRYKWPHGKWTNEGIAVIIWYLCSKNLPC